MVRLRTDAAVLADPRSLRLLAGVQGGQVVRGQDDGTPENAEYTFESEDVRRPLHWLIEEGLVVVDEGGAPVLTARAEHLVNAWRAA